MYGYLHILAYILQTMLVFKYRVIFRCSFVDLLSRRPDIWFGSLLVKFSLNPPAVNFLLPGTSIFLCKYGSPTHYIRLNMNTSFTKRTRGDAWKAARKVFFFCDAKERDNFYLFGLQRGTYISYYFRRNFDSVFHNMWQMTSQISKPHYYTRRLNWTARKMMLCNQLKLPQNKKKILILWIIQLLEFCTKLHAFMMEFIFWIIHANQ